MCGLAGLWTCRSSPENELHRLAEAMTATLLHRGPDDAGVWVDPACGLALGHRRLSILDLTPEGHQPMHSHNAEWVVVYNGEIYNFQEIRRDLASRGHRFRGHSDTEVMLAAFTEWGVESSLRRFNGMFAFAAFHRPARELWLARDRLGKKPLYYGWAGRTLLFASELKALRAHPDFAAEIDPNAAALFFRHGYVPSPYSIYRGIRKLPPASLVKLSSEPPGSLPEPALYWSAREVVERGLAEPFSGDEQPALDHLHDLLSDSVRLRMISDVPLGAFLSGGIDSSLVVALMQSLGSRPVRTFSIGFQEESFNEAEHARAVARHLGAEHTELYVTPQQARAVIPKLPGLYDEPFADSSQIPTFLVSELARRHVTVSLSGDGGDELFAGYHAYQSNAAGWRKMERLPGPVRRLAGSLLRAFGPDAFNFALAPLKPLLPARYRCPDTGARLHRLGFTLAHSSYEMIYRDLLPFWEDPAALLPGSAEPPTAFSDSGRHLRRGSFVERMMYLDAVSYLPDDILVKVDRASMGVSLEARCPLLDYRLFELAWRFPLTWKFAPGKGKLPLRRILARYVPERLWERPKSGFGVPVGEWIRGPLREWAEDLLSEAALREISALNPVPVRRRWSEHLSGRFDWASPLWAVLMFQAWRRAEKPPEVR